MNEAEPLQFHFLGAGISLELLNTPLLCLNVALEVSILLLQRPDFVALLRKGAQALRSPQHDGCIRREAGKSRDCRDRPKKRT